MSSLAPRLPGGIGWCGCGWVGGWESEWGGWCVCGEGGGEVRWTFSSGGGFQKFRCDFFHFLFFEFSILLFFFFSFFNVEILHEKGCKFCQ